MKKVRERIAQPPINPWQRATERRDFWPGLILGIIGLIVLACGAWNATSVETTEGGTAWEFELVRAFSYGGLQRVEIEAPPDPATFADPAQAAAAMERFEQRRAAADSGGRLRYRVNPDAQTPCPT